MTLLLILFVILLIGLIIVQIGRVRELTGRIKGEELAYKDSSRTTGILLLLFLVGLLVAVIWSAMHYKNFMFSWGPNVAASKHGPAIDKLTNINILITGIVFVVTQVLLFWFAFRYRYSPKRKATYFAHDNRLEIIWTAIPAVVMTILVISGLTVWNKVMDDVDEGEDHIEFEATGSQFLWYLRYPGADGKLGTRDYKLTSGINPLGQVWDDPANYDDFHPSEIVLPVNKKVRVKIMSRDVIHNFYLPHFRLKMDAVPGMPTYFVFTPTITTEAYRNELRTYEEFQAPADPDDPNGPQKWEVFDFELACAELCGSGHFSMKKIVKIVSESEYNAWLATQKSYYLTTVRGSDEDPNAGKFIEYEVAEYAKEFNPKFESAVKSETSEDDLFLLRYVRYQTGSDALSEDSHYELDNVISLLNSHPDVKVELGGHTDNTGNPDLNLKLSRDRAESVRSHLIKGGIDGSRLIAKGYGQAQPIDTNDTEEGRANNRRTELRILS